MLDGGAEAGADRLAIWSAKARILRAGGRNEEALAAWKAAAAEKPDDSSLKFEVAAETWALGWHAEALAAYRAIIDNERIACAQRRDAALAAGRLARDQICDRLLAKGYFEQAVSLDPDHIPAQCELANEYRIANRLGDAETIYRKVLSQDAESVWALGGLALTRRLAGDPDEALELIEKACANDPMQEWNRLEHGHILRDVGRAEEAAALMESFESSSAVYAPARVALGQLARAWGDHRRAADYFEQAAEKAADPMNALDQLAGAKCALGDFMGARDVIARMLARDSLSHRAHLADGLLKRATSDRRGAREAFARAAEMAPTEAQPQVEIAAEDVACGDLKGAVAALDIALKINPQHEEALLKKASLLAAQGEDEAALVPLAQLRAERPKSVWAYLVTAQILTKAGDFAGALRITAAAREACLPNPQLDAEEASILRQQGLLDKSYQKIAAANESFPLEFLPWSRRISAAIDLGDFEAAEAFLAVPPPSAATSERGNAAKLRAEFDKARWALEAAIEDLDAAIDIDVNDAAAAEERAKLRLITFDLPGAWLDLKAQAEAQSAGAKRKKNPLHSLTGQLYEEFVMDRALAADLAVLRGLAPRDQMARLAELVRGHPDSTAPAIGLMIALRRLGGFDLRQVTPQELAPRIPRLITQFWNDRQPPPDVARLMQSWKGFDPGFEIERFDDASALAYLRARCDPSVGRAFSRAGEPAQRADLFRLARLFFEGGYFIDADDRVRGGLEAYVPRHAEFFAHQEDIGSIGNNVLGAVPRHPAIGLALNEAVSAILRGDRDLVWLTTGPGLLTRSLARWLAAEPERLGMQTASIAILTLAEMRRVAAIHCHAAYKKRGRAWLSGAFAKRDNK